MKYLLKTVSLVICTTFLLALQVIAQDSSVQLVKDPRIDVLVKKQSQINKLSSYKNSRGEYKGFRIMLLNTNNRDLAYKTRADILRAFPSQNIYLGYQAPYYKLKLGDFIKRADAEKMKKELTTVFDQNTFIVPDLVKITPEEEARLMKEEVEE